MVLEIAILASTRGTDMQALIDEIEAGRLEARIACVISNKQEAYALERARKHGIEAVFIDPKNKTREQYDDEIMKELEKRNAGLVLLIGYMKIITKPLVEKYKNKIINIHPSLLPAFAGGMDTDVHRMVLDYGCKITGCTLHFVTEEVDKGPVIIQKAVSIAEHETADTLKKKVQKAEQDAVVEAVRLFGEGRMRIEGKRVRLL